MCHVNLTQWIEHPPAVQEVIGLNPVTDTRFFFWSHIYDMLTYTNLKVHLPSLFQNFFSKMLAHNQQKIVHLIT